MTLKEIREHYIKQDEKLKGVFNYFNYPMKYDYRDEEFLNKIEILFDSIPKRKIIENETSNTPFLEYLSIIFEEIGNEELFNLILEYYSRTKIKVSDINYYDSYVSYNHKNNNISYTININDKKTNLNNSILMHELIHLPQLEKTKNIEPFENIEILSIYFEYLINKVIDDKNGYDIFVNNRLFGLKRNSDFFKSDKYYAINNKIINIGKYRLFRILCTRVAYLDGFEYALSLIERSKEDEKIVYDSVSKLLLDESNFDVEAKKLDIDVSKYENIKKLTKSKC